MPFQGEPIGSEIGTATARRALRGAAALLCIALLTVGCAGPRSQGTVAPGPTPEPTPEIPVAEALDETVTDVATPRPAPTWDPAIRLPGGAAALPAVPDGVAFRGHLLIVDRGNLRIVEIDPDGDMTWSFPRPDDAEAHRYAAWDDANYGVDGTTIYANSDPTSTVIAIDVATRTVKWHKGTPNQPGRGEDGFAGPDDAVQGLDGTVWVADIRNCRIVRLSGADGHFLGSLGDGKCAHKPPGRFASPNGAFPTANGDIIVTEIGGQWIDRIGPDGSLRWAFRSPTAYPSDAMALPDGSVLVTDYTQPGQVLRLAPDGTVRWRFDAGGKLVNPSSAVPLASNRIAIGDDFGDRVLIVDPTTDQIVREFRSAGGIPFKWIDSVDFRPD